MLKKPFTIGQLVYDQKGNVGQVEAVLDRWAYVDFVGGYKWWMHFDKLTLGEL